MADKPENNLPKVPPFLIPGASNQHAEEPPLKNAHVVQAPKNSLRIGTIIILPAGYAQYDDFIGQHFELGNCYGGSCVGCN